MKIGDVIIYKPQYIEKKVDYMRDCEHCAFSWEDRGYEGECYDYGCVMDKGQNALCAPLWACLLPRWIKRLIKKLKKWN